MRSKKKALRAPRLVALVAAVAFMSLATPAFAGGSTVDRIVGPFETVVPVAVADNPAGVELMFAECDFVHRVVLPDGSAKEIETCHLTGPFFDFPGSVPDKAFGITGGACVWFSDYMTQLDGTDLFADSVRITVTPSGNVHITSTYPAEPIPLSDC